MDLGPHTLYKWIKSFTIRIDSKASGATEHESALCSRADLTLGVLSDFRRRISDSRYQLRNLDFQTCICVNRRYCPTGNSVQSLARKERSVYVDVPPCKCGCTYCTDSPTLRAKLFPQLEAYGETPVLRSNIPGVNCHNYGDICYDNQRLEGLQIASRNVQLKYGSDYERYSYAIRVPTSDCSGKTVKQKVFQSKSGWGSESEDDSPPAESVLDYDSVIRSNYEELCLQPIKIRRLNGTQELTPAEYPSIRIGSFVDVNHITRVSYID